MLRKWLVYTLASGLAVRGVKWLMDQNARRAAPRGERREALQRWEDEGGLVPGAVKPASE